MPDVQEALTKQGFTAMVEADSLLAAYAMLA
jgi:hypothetical protein